VEFLNATDPGDPGSYLKIHYTAEGTGVRVRFMTQPGEAYAVEHSESLGTNGWQRVQDVPATPLTHETEYLLPVTPGQPVGFYRLVRVGTP
jgi:hypothetical protein